MKQALQNIICGTILTAVGIGLVLTGCDSPQLQLSKEEQELIDSLLNKYYIGQREDGAKVYSMKLNENECRQYIMKQKDGSYRFAFSWKGISEKEVLENPQNKYIEFYYDPNNTDPNTLKLIKLLESR